MRKFFLFFTVCVFSVLGVYAQANPHDVVDEVLLDSVKNCAYLTLEDYKNGKRSYENCFEISDHHKKEMAKEWCKVKEVEGVRDLNIKKEIWAVQRDSDLYINIQPKTKLPLFVKSHGEGRYALLIMTMPPTAAVLKQMKASPEMLRDLRAKKTGAAVSGMMFGAIGSAIASASSKPDPFYVVMDMSDGSMWAFTQEMLKDYMERYSNLKPEYEFVMVDLMKDEDYRIFIRDLNLADEGKPVPVRYP